MITITGASGNTGSVAAKLLLDNGEKVRLIGRSANKLVALSKRGAEVIVGDQSDWGFLARALHGSDALYLMIPPKYDAADVRAYYNSMGDGAVKAIRDSGVKKVVFLSSLGAELTEGTGPVLGLHDVEEKLKGLKGVDIVFLRPGYFMENILNNIGLIKHQSINGNPIAPDSLIRMVATKDIGSRVASLLSKRVFTGITVEDLFGEQISYKEVTALIGKSIGKENLPYIQFNDEDALKAMMGMGLSSSVASSFIEMSHGLDAGKVSTTTIDASKPNAPTRFETFVKEVFAPAYAAAG